MRLGKGCEKREGEEEVGDAARAVRGEGMLDDVVGGGAGAGNGAGNETWVVGDGGTGVRDLHRRAVGHGLEEAEEGDFMGGEAGRGRRGGADARDVHGAAGEGREDQSMGEGFVAGEAQEFGIGRRHRVEGRILALSRHGRQENKQKLQVDEADDGGAGKNNFDRLPFWRLIAAEWR